MNKIHTLTTTLDNSLICGKYTISLEFLNTINNFHGPIVNNPQTMRILLTTEPKLIESPDLEVEIRKYLEKIVDLGTINLLIEETKRLQEK